GYELFLMARGRFQEAIAEGKIEVALDPLWHGSHGTLAQAYVESGQPDEGLAVLGKVRDFFPAMWVEGLAYEQKKEPAAAISIFRENVRIYGRTFVEADLARAYALAGHRAEADTILAELLQRRQQGYFSAYRIAIIYTGLGKEEQVFRWLGIACNEADPWLNRLPTDLSFAAYRSRPQFVEIEKKIAEIGRRFPD